MLRSPWTPGSYEGRGGGRPVLVSVTDFRLDRRRDLPGVHRAARRLAADWPALEGAYGMWLWAQPLARRCGAVAVWRDEAALRAFVTWPPHVAIMRAYRGRGALTSTGWEAARFEPAAIWGRARGVIGEGSGGGGF
ncbi:hypothetical protein OG259_15955 [Streptomyces sp. NBC_00250]|uniref:hypothetical protein n=1 Tax=Streptomyces sp. NBC_00250 TaxID=2903641 RepID=UPI002E2D8A8B|nr:hypothetical protein [Streptomyces sp. NBC_00250]